MLPPYNSIGLIGSLKAGGSIFRPTDIPNLSLWLDAADLSTITEVGGSVSQWDDKSGNGNHATQGTASLQPQTNINTINGSNVIYFDNDQMTGSVNIGVNKTFFVSCRRLSPFTGNQTILELYNGDRFAVYCANDGSVQIHDGEINPVFRELFPAGTITAGTEFIIAVRLSGTILQAFYNGLAGNSVDIGAESPTISFIIGDDSTGGDSDLLDYAEVVLYNSALSNAEMNDIGNYLSNKWAISWTNL